ncbi:surface antigen (D15) [Emticicia oligotrophica DSM 17448]|uniref:Surface antigen (D15) n=1 Tax=Emticicia oligotrophica (strain DSM 17448 / CIP 109782 / MTCC 6937 / GPTSA100-15) TaxID=929562 RepID=A0ABN4AII1_EMTOG|nr:BamA/TamA family outer membrane protein [Emticicia oligotrophica]AFK01879.1 surface antigen (D15) [Emticicia oligotrophica DSM 17448]
MRTKQIENNFVKKPKNIFFYTKNICFWGLIFLLSSCSVNKYIPEGESLYTGAKVKTIADSSLNSKQVKFLNEQLITIIRPVPNSTIMGFPYKLWLYSVIGKPKSEKGFRQWFRKRFGEAPVLASKRAVTINTDIISNYLNNEGYFRSTATGELVIKGKKSEAVYIAHVKPRYTIDKVEFVKKDSSIFSLNLLKTKENSLLKVGEPYRFELVKLERDRIDKVLKTNGYYYFRPDFLIVKADTNQNKCKVDLYVELKPNILQTSLKQYSIKDIQVYIDTPDSSGKLIQIRKGLKVFQPKYSYNPKVFNDAIGFRSGRLYSSQTHDASLSRLINLRNFKFVKNRFEMVNRSDSAQINVIYDLTSLKKKSLQAETNFLTRSNNLAGTQLGINWLNRNLFKRAEILKLGINTGYDFQLASKQLNTQLNNYFRIAGDADLTFPRFLLPFYQVRAGRNQALPKTNINIGYERLVQKGVGINIDSSKYRYNQYTITSLRGSISYSLRKSAAIEHNFSPLSINLIRPKNISEEFVNKIFNSTNIQDLLRYDQILNTRLILGGQYNIVYTPVQPIGSRHYFYLNAGVDMAGNMSGLVRKKLEDGSKRILNTVFEQYVRFDLETRYYLDLSHSIRWANRAILGYGLSYGNSKSLPNQVKQYSIGGSNSIRAFRARSIGPGDFNITGDSTAIFTNAYGDVKLELNSELRIKFSQIINLAAFVDAGNIWMAKYNEALGYPTSSTFGKDFYKQLAVGGGLGLRLDFTYVKLRLDLATPFRKPWLAEKERWVIQEIKPFERAWRKQNLILNIAVDYPF